VTALPETVIEPRPTWQLLGLGELWRYRDLLLLLVWRDVSVRYKQTALGIVWAVLQPALMMGVFVAFLGRLAHVPSGGVPYPLFVYAGLLPWSFFATAVAGAAGSVVESERLITKVYFPRLLIPFAAAGAALVDLAVASGLLVVLMLAFGYWPSWAVLLVPVVVALLGLAALGVGSLLAALNVAYRDFRYVLPFLIQLWLFATPSVYLATDGADEEGLGLGGLMWLNPLTGLIAFFRAAVLGQPLPWAALGFGAALALVLFVAGCYYFRRVEDSFADVI
jgi:lipopolysaccharide transport system permease protein